MQAAGAVSGRARVVLSEEESGAAVSLGGVGSPVVDGWATGGRLHTFLTETASSARDTEQLLRRPGWRIIGAIGYLSFDIAMLFACFAAAGHPVPLAPVVLGYPIGYISNFIPVPGGIGVLDGSMIGMLVLYGVGGTVAAAATLV
jgi:uncharacterized protein (TIRG00374 family)